MNQFQNMEQYHLMHLHQQHHLIHHYMLHLETTEHVATRAAGSVIVTEQEAVQTSRQIHCKYKNLQQDR